MEADQRFLILCGGEILAVAAGNLAVALILQILILAVFLDDRRGYPVFIAAAALYAAAVAISGHILLPLLALASRSGAATSPSPSTITGSRSGQEVPHGPQTTPTGEVSSSSSRPRSSSSLQP